MIRVNYEIVVLYKPDGHAVAFVKGDGPDDEQPLRGEGETPLLALAALTACLREWHIGGSNRWLNTPSGRAFVEECRAQIDGPGTGVLN